MQSAAEEITRILDAGRWAPSGDNAQPWIFRIDGPTEITVRISCDLGNVYEYSDGEPTIIAAGMMLENLRLGAAEFNKLLAWEYVGCAGSIHTLRLHLTDDGAHSDRLYAQIYQRSVDRRPYEYRPIDAATIARLKDVSGQEFQIDWFEDLSKRLRIAFVIGAATDIRLRIPEAYSVHRRIVDWSTNFSPRGIPASALGLDRMTVKMMRWSMAKWSRVRLSNGLGSPKMASLQMDLVPAIFSAAYFMFRVKREADPFLRAIQLLRLGQATQRFWLAATQEGLVMQPCFAPLAFSFYGREKLPFTTSLQGRRAAQRLAAKWARLVTQPEEIAFLGRIGWPKPRMAIGRSTRMPFNQLFEARGS